ncbi:unnamed protein product, partial [Alternaria alternata]
MTEQVQSPHQQNQSSTLNNTRCHSQQLSLASLPVLPSFRELPQLIKLKRYWNLEGELRKKYKDYIFPEINRLLQLFFDSDRKGELVTIDVYMIGKSQETAKPTILLIGGDSKTREGAKRALNESTILADHPGWCVDHTSDFPSLGENCDEPSALEGFEFWSLSGTINWRDEDNCRSQATEVYFDLRPYSIPTTRVPSKGLAIYIKHPSDFRPATANIVRLGDRIFLQTVYHTFHLGGYTKKPTETDGTQRNLPPAPSIETFAVVGRLLVWSVARDWALIEVSSEHMQSRMSQTLAEDERANCLFQRAERPSITGDIAITWTASSGMLEVTLSETTTYMKMPNSDSFEEVHKARLVKGSWSNGDSGAVVMHPTRGITFGHILGGNRATGVALILAANKVVEEFRELDFSSHLHLNVSNAWRTHMPGVIRETIGTKTSNFTKADSSVPFSEHLFTNKGYLLGQLTATDDSILEPLQASPLGKQSEDSQKRATEVSDRQTLARRENVLGRENPETLDTVKNQGKLDEAEEMLMRALQGKEIALGRDHPSTLDTVNNLGNLYADQGRLSEAEQMYERALRGYEALGLDNNAPTLNTVNNLGLLYAAQGRLDKAEQMLMQALQGKKKAFGREHPDTLTSMANLASTYRDQGRWDEAEKLEVQVIETSGHYGNALQATSYSGLKEVVTLLLDKGADVNAQGGQHGNALQVASERGHEAVVKLLLDKGADVNVEGGEYGNALQAASAGGHEQIVKMLLDAGAEVNAQGGRYGNALQAASARGHEQVLKILLDAGAEVNAQGGYYGNALQAASARGHEAVVKLLLDKGADVNVEGGEYGNALQAASAGGHEQIVKMLLDAGAEVNAQGGRYGNALQAASAGGHEQIVKMLLNA